MVWSNPEWAGLAGPDADALRRIFNSLTTNLDAPFCWVTQSNVQSIPETTSTILFADIDKDDAYGMHDTVTNNSRIYIPKDGLYSISAVLLFNNSINFRLRQLQLYADGLFISNLVADVGAGDSFWASFQSGHSIHRLATGQYLELSAYQQSGGAKNGRIERFQVAYLSS